MGVLHTITYLMQENFLKICFFPLNQFSRFICFSFNSFNVFLFIEKSFLKGGRSVEFCNVEFFNVAQPKMCLHPMSTKCLFRPKDRDIFTKKLGTSKIDFCQNQSIQRSDCRINVCHSSTNTLPYPYTCPTYFRCFDQIFSMLTRRRGFRFPFV